MQQRKAFRSSFLLTQYLLNIIINFQLGLMLQISCYVDFVINIFLK